MNQVFFREVVDTFNESFAVLDSSFRVIFANKSFYKKFRLNSKKVIGKLFFSLDDGQWNVEELKILLKDVLPNKSIFRNFEINHRFNNAGLMCMNINAKEIIEGPEKKILLTIEDVSDQKKAEEYAIQAAKLSAVGQLSAGIAHGLSSPLTGIHSFLDVYIRDEKEGSEKYKELRLMLNGCEYMADIISNLTYFASKKEDSFKVLDLNELATSVLLFVERQLMVRNIKLVKKFSFKEIKIKGNKAHLQHALLNVVLNSMEACVDGNTIKVITRVSKEKLACIEIIDDGSGIKKQHLKKVFDPFFSTKSISKGSGLGLTSTRDIIIAHEGEIMINSNGIKGTTVKMYLKQVKDEK